MATTTNFGWETPDDSDLVKDGALAMRTLGNAIDTSLVDLKGGTTGQVLSKTSNTDMDFTWVTSDDANAIQNAIVDAKGDLITATAADTPARLAVGSNGDTLVADSAASTGLRWSGGTTIANPVINGGMDIWQRGTSFSITSTNAYTADRFNVQSAGPALTASRQITSDSTNLPNIQYCLRVQRNSGNTSTSAIIVQSMIETVNTIPFAGKTVTVSFYARKGADFSPTSSNIEVTLYTGTGTDQSIITGSYTGQATPINASNAVLTTTWQRFTYTATLGSTVSEMALYFRANPIGTASTNDYFEITGVQMDIGSVALPFRRSGGTLQGETALCQRYYQRVTGITSNSTYILTGVAVSTTRAFLAYSAPVTLRGTPSIAHSLAKVGNGVITNQSLSSISAYANGSYQQITIDANVSSGLAQSGAFMLVLDQNAYIELSAEL
jgi:hypothetical protein